METQIETLYDERTGESLVHAKHKTGLDIYLKEMPGFHTCHALFGTRYGSINTMFRLNGEKDYAQVPNGIAHFLEHKLFENEDCDAFEQYAKTGADANAYTSFDRTCYLFSCSENVNASLEILLNFVQAPYFTKENVDKEQGIIGQEIRMMDDEPSWRVFFGMLQGLYHNHPVKIDIAGTVESIAQIDAELLYRCYHTFYNLHNMVLSVAGNIKVDEVLALCDRLLKPCPEQLLEEVFPDEPEGIAQREVHNTLSVGTPIFNFGFKMKPRQGEDLVRAQILSSMILETLLGKASPFYREMLEKEWLTPEFETDSSFAGDGYFALLCAGESNHARELCDTICSVIETAKCDGFDKDRFETLRRVEYGSAIRECNNVTEYASAMLDAYMARVSPFVNTEILASITYEDALAFLREEIDTDKTVLSIVASA